VGQKTNAPTDKRTGTGPKRSAAPLNIIVRRGALRRFDALTRKTVNLPVTVTWDRRVKNQRGAAQAVDQDRRKKDRRRKPPFTWDLADFVVVDPRGRRTVKGKTPKD
jgi:hypothetical protein